MEQVTEEVKAVKIEEKPKETKTEVVDEVEKRFILYAVTVVLLDSD